MHTISTLLHNLTGACPLNSFECEAYPYEIQARSCAELLPDLIELHIRPLTHYLDVYAGQHPKHLTPSEIRNLQAPISFHGAIHIDAAVMLIRGLFTQIDTIPTAALQS